MFSNINTQALLELVKNNEKVNNFDLRHLIDDCGTFGCLIGNDYIQKHGKFNPIIDYSMNVEVSQQVFEWSKSEYCLPKSIWNFLFQYYDANKTWRGILLNSIGCARDCSDKKAALRRVRKFIYYYLHKQELIYDERGCVRETIRRQEGNYNIVNKVKEKALQVA